MDPNPSNTGDVKVSVISPSAYVRFLIFFTDSIHFIEIYSVLICHSTFCCLYFRAVKMRRIHRIRICLHRTLLLSHSPSHLLNFVVSTTTWFYPHSLIFHAKKHSSEPIVVVIRCCRLESAFLSIWKRIIMSQTYKYRTVPCLGRSVSSICWSTLKCDLWADQTDFVSFTNNETYKPGNCALWLTTHDNQLVLRELRIYLIKTIELKALL